MRRWVASSVVVAACYHPKPPTGVPCDSPTDCPSGQVCTLGTCESHPLDAPLDLPRLDAPPPDAAVDVSLIAHWTFEAIVDGRCADATGHGHDAELDGAGLTTGVAGNGLAIAITTFATVASLDGSVFGAGSLTVSLCLSSASNVGSFDMPFFMGGSSAFVPGVDLELGTNDWTFNVSDGTGAVGGMFQLTVADQTFAGTGFHCFALAVDRNSGTAFGYRDGALVNQTSIAISPLPGNEKLRFGGSNTNEFVFDGVIDEVRMYTRALDAAEIAALHAP